MRVLFICTGNTCRSPMAQYLFDHYSQSDENRADSCGFATMCGDTINPNSAAVLAQLGIDTTSFRSKRFEIYSVDNFDKIFVFTPAALQALKQSLSHKQAKKVFLLGRGIADPYGQSVDVYRQCRDEIAAAVKEILASEHHQS